MDQSLELHDWLDKNGYEISFNPYSSGSVIGTLMENIMLPELFKGFNPYSSGSVIGTLMENIMLPELFKGFNPYSSGSVIGTTYN